LDFTEFTEEDFPFDMKQAPSTSNALGLVKYMFPNRYNIYLHDTPAKSLFAEESRAFSHGCIRLGDPFDFGYALLALQTNDPEGVFHEALETGEETQIDLEQHVPIHIMYRTAVGSADGNMGYRRDVYGRDAQIWSALESAGVELGV
jgi:murein L,D-transpeptidase YcbB/YkuD